MLLQTAKAVATNEDGTRSTNVRIIFDNGSQRSYVTNSLELRLNLKPCKTETLHLNTFRKQNCDVVKIRLNKPGCEEVEVSALTFPAIKIEVSQFPYLEAAWTGWTTTSKSRVVIDRYSYLNYDGKRYLILHVGLPWKKEKEPIPSGYQLCYKVDVTRKILHYFANMIT